MIPNGHPKGWTWHLIAFNPNLNQMPRPTLGFRVRSRGLLSPLKTGGFEGWGFSHRMILEVACRPTKGQDRPPEVESFQPNPFLKACSQTPSPASDESIAAVVACEDISGRGRQSLWPVLGSAAANPRMVLGFRAQQSTSSPSAPPPNP